MIGAGAMTVSPTPTLSQGGQEVWRALCAMFIAAERLHPLELQSDRKRIMLNRRQSLVGVDQ
jgi:hypothetical protein